MNPLYVFEGYTIEEPWVIVLALAHNYDRLRQVPSDETNGIGVSDVGDQYARGTRASYALANWIRAQGYHAEAYPGPMADALLLVPPAIAAGLGELGKHGSLISPQFGAGVRLAGVTTDMPLVGTRPIQFGADDFCLKCQACTRACPPRSHTGAEADGPRREALVCELRQMYSLFRGGSILRDLHRHLSLDQTECKAEALSLNKSPASINCRVVAFCFASLTLLQGCMVGPKYVRPSVQAPPAFKETADQTAPDGTTWTSAKPRDATLRGKWWEIIRSPN